MAVFKVGTRIIDQYTLDDHCGHHGTVIEPYKGPLGWSKIWSRINCDCGKEITEMNKYLIREPKVKS